MRLRKLIIFIILPFCLILYTNCSQSFKALTDVEDGAPSSGEQTSESEEGDNNGGDSENNGNTSDESENNTNTNQRPGPALLAVGQMQSSMYSCDGGMSWRGYQTLNSNQRCWDQSADNFDCGHHEFASLGAVWGDQGFLATFGWGQPGGTFKTTDGINWIRVFEGGQFAGVSFGNSSYMLNARNPRFSQNGGITWESRGQINSIPFNQRSTFFIPSGGGRFVSLSSSDGVVDMMISKDNGASFFHPNVLPAGCGSGSHALANNMVMVHSQRLCVSVDNGDTWLDFDLPGDMYEQLATNGNEFRIYRAGYFIQTSSNLPINWVRRNITLEGVPAPDLTLSFVTYQPEHGRYAATNQRWRRWYEHTEFYYSDDGIDWHRVNKQAGNAPLAPHPIKQISTGFLESCVTP